VASACCRAGLPTPLGRQFQLQVFAVSKLAKVANVFLTVEWNNWMYGGEGDYYC
jgi:hypothetical protein